MKKILFAMLCLSNLIFGQSKNFIDMPYLETKLMQDTLILPNVIKLNIDLELHENTENLTLPLIEKKFVSFLSEKGIDTTQHLRKKSFRKIFQNTSFDNKKQKTTYGWTAGSMAQVEEICNLLSNHFVVRFQLVAMHHSDLEQIKLQQKLKAIDKVKHQAQKMAENIGQKLLGVIHLTDSQNVIDTSKPVAKQHGMVDNVLFEHSENGILINTEVNIKYELETT